MKRHYLLAACTLPFLVTALAAQTVNYSNPYAISTPAGNSNGGGYQNGSGSDALFNRPTGVVFGPDGAIYVADALNFAIRRVDPTSGATTTFAGTPGTEGETNSTALNSTFGPVYGIAVDANGNYYVSDWVNAAGTSGVLRKISSAGNVTTLATGLANPQGLAVDGSGNVYVACSGDFTVRKVTPQGSVSLYAGTAGGNAMTPGAPGTGQFGLPTSVAVGPNGTLFVTDVGASVIEQISSNGTISIYSGSVSHAGVSDGATANATFSHPAGIAIDGSNNLYVIDDNSVVREINVSTNVVTTLAGDPGIPGTLDGSGPNARFNFRVAVGGIAATSSGNLAIADTTNATIRYGIPVPVGPPTIQYQPTGESVNNGGTVTLSVTANGSNLTYQWMFNDGYTNRAITGATSPTLMLSGLGANQAGNYTVVVTNAQGSVTSAAADITISTQAHLLNLSARANTAAGGSILDAGFTLSGSGTKPILVRGVGPALGGYGVTGFVTNPVLTVYNSNQVQLAQNIGWNNDPTLQAAFNNTDAFNFPANSADSALLETLSASTYTATVLGVNNATGNALVELYDDAAANTSCNLINLSARAVVTPAAPLTAGFVIGGSSPMTVLIRGIGPALTGFGVSGALPNTSLTVYDVNRNPLTSNVGWGGSTALSDMFQKVYAFSLAPGSADSALIITLAPGNYTAAVSPSDGTSSGVALVEVYEIQ